MVVKIYPTDTTRRTVVRPRRSPDARASVFVAHLEIPLLVRTFVWHPDGFPGGEVIMGNVVCRPTQTQPDIQYNDAEEGRLHESCVASCGKSTFDLCAVGRPPVRTTKGNASVVSDQPVDCIRGAKRVSVNPRRLRGGAVLPPTSTTTACHAKLMRSTI